MQEIIIDFPAEYKVKCKLLDLKKELEFIKICEGLKTFIDEKVFPGSIFLMKNNKYYFEIGKKIIWCRYSNVWSIFSENFCLSPDDTQTFLRKQIEEHFKLKDFTPLNFDMLSHSW